jgi:replicative DNA helicase
VYGDVVDFNNEALKTINDGIRMPESARKGITAGDIVEEVYKDLTGSLNDQDDTKLYTGLESLDTVIAGLHKQEMTVIGARPGVGKTMLAVHIAQVLANKGNKCLIVSREMSSKQLAKRMISAKSGIDGQKLRIPKYLSTQDWKDIANATGRIIDDDIRIDDEALTVQAIRARCRELHDKGVLDVLFVDYLTLLRSQRKAESRRIEIEDVSWQLKEIAKEFDIPVVVLAQLNRSPAIGDREPTLTDLRETGAIEQDADNVLLLHINKASDNDEHINPDIVTMKIIVAKQRNGPVGFVEVKQH